MQAKLFWEQQAKLGEGPFWQPQENQLFYVDIENGEVHCIWADTMAHKAYKVANYATCINPTRGGIAVTTKNEVLLLNFATGKTAPLATIDMPAHVRLNDGKCDAAGRLWVGSMVLDESGGAAKDGELFCVERGKSSSVLQGFGTANGLAWSRDNTLFYHIDTPEREIREYPFEVSTGKLGAPRVCVRLPEGIGNPDGMTIDEAGNLWVALWGGGAVAQFSPQSGALLQRIEVPAENVTCCVFGGKNMDVLYITTAMNDAGEGGEIYCVSPGTKGFLPLAYRQ